MYRNCGRCRHVFPKIGGELLECLEKHTVFLTETEVGIFYLLGRDERIPIADSLIVLTDLDTDIIQMTVDPVGLDAPAFGTTAADFPCSGTESFALNCAMPSLTVIRPMTGTSACFFSLFLLR